MSKMSKTQESHRKNRGLLKVSKRHKIMATFASMRGFPFRQTILLLGEAEKNYKENGRLVLGENRAD